MFAGLAFLSSRSFSAALWLAGWLAGYIFMETRSGGTIKKYFIRQKHKKTKKRLNKFTVIDGGKDDTFH